MLAFPEFAIRWKIMETVKNYLGENIIITETK